MAREMVYLLAARLPGRRIDVVGDAAYASEAWRGRRTRRSRSPPVYASNAAIYAPTPERTGKRGRPRKWGPRLGKPCRRSRLDPATRLGRHHRSPLRQDRDAEAAASLDCLWEPLGAHTPVRVDPRPDDTKPAGYQLALITTDLTSTPAQIVERYARALGDRGVLRRSQAPSRRRRRREPHRETPCKRTVPFQFLDDEPHDHLVRRCTDITPTTSPSTAPAPRGTCPRPTHPSPTCSPSSDARSSPTNIHPDGSAPPTNRKSTPSNKPGPPCSAKPPKSRSI